MVKSCVRYRPWAEVTYRIHNTYSDKQPVYHSHGSTRIITPAEAKKLVASSLLGGHLEKPSAHVNRSYEQGRNEHVSQLLCDLHWLWVRCGLPLLVWNSASIPCSCRWYWLLYSAVICVVAGHSESKPHRPLVIVHFPSLCHQYDSQYHVVILFAGPSVAGKWKLVSNYLFWFTRLLCGTLSVKNLSQLAVAWNGLNNDNCMNLAANKL